MGSELSQSSAACTQALRRSEADLGSLRDELADIAGDGIELRRQVLALCTQSSEDRAEVAALPGIGEEESGAEAREIIALRDRLEQLEARDVDSEVRSQCRNLSDSVRATRVELADLVARMAAGEQNATRGLTMLQQAVEGVRVEHKDLRQAMDGRSGQFALSSQKAK